MKLTTENAHALRTLVLLIGVVAAFSVSVFLGSQYVTNQAKQIKYSAIDGCAQIATVSFENKDAAGQLTSSKLPSTDVYNKCLKDKGIEIK